MKKNKGFTSIGIIIAIIVALIVGGGAVYYATNTSAPASQVNIDTTKKEANSTSILTNETANWKTYTNSKYGYSFQYPEKLYIDTPTISDSVFLSHRIPFENRNGGCDMNGDSELSKTLGDFGMSISIVSGKVNPPYVDGNYSVGALNGEWAYMGAEGCGQTSYYFPISGNRTLVVEKTQVQMLSNVVTPETRAKVLAVPGVISQEESKTIFDQILSTFKFTNQASGENSSSGVLKNQPAFLISAYSKNGKNYIDVDYVEWLHGDASIKAQIEDGQCVSASECYDYPNGYKRNKNPLIRTFEVNANATIQIAGFFSCKKLNGCGQNSMVTFDEFKNLAAQSVYPNKVESPFKQPKTFIEIDIQNNKIINITEPYQE